jgi:hypothetical protein
MTVKDLKQALEKFDNDAIVCIDAMEDCCANVVKQYNATDGRKFAYIADNLEYVEGVFAILVDQCIVGYEED